jgi:hypothetical protein
MNYILLRSITNSGRERERKRGERASERLARHRQAGHLYMYNARTFSFFFLSFHVHVLSLSYMEKNVQCINNIRTMYILRRLASFSPAAFGFFFFTDSPTTSFANSERKRTTLCTRPSLNLQLKQSIPRCRPNTSTGDDSATVTL